MVYNSSKFEWQIRNFGIDDRKNIDLFIKSLIKKFEYENLNIIKIIYHDLNILIRIKRNSP